MHRSAASTRSRNSKRRLSRKKTKTSNPVPVDDDMSIATQQFLNVAGSAESRALELKIGHANLISREGRALIRMIKSATDLSNFQIAQIWNISNTSTVDKVLDSTYVGSVHCKNSPDDPSNDAAHLQAFCYRLQLFVLWVEKYGNFKVGEVTLPTVNQDDPNGRQSLSSIESDTGSDCEESESSDTDESVIEIEPPPPSQRKTRSSTSNRRKRRNSTAARQAYSQTQGPPQSQPSRAAQAADVPAVKSSKKRKRSDVDIEDNDNDEGLSSTGTDSHQEAPEARRTKRQRSDERKKLASVFEEIGYTPVKPKKSVRGGFGCEELRAILQMTEKEAIETLNGFPAFRAGTTQSQQEFFYRLVFSKKDKVRKILG